MLYLGGSPRNLFLKGRACVCAGTGGGALPSSAIMDNLWSRELAREPALLLLGPLAEWRGRDRSLKLGEPTKSIDMVSVRATLERRRISG